MLLVFIYEFQKILKFGDEKFNETCFEGRRLDIRVIVDEEYARKWKEDKGGAGNDFSFKFALNPNCTKIPKKQTSMFTFVSHKYCITQHAVIRLLSLQVVLNYYLKRNISYLSLFSKLFQHKKKPIHHCDLDLSLKICSK